MYISVRMNYLEANLLIRRQDYQNKLLQHMYLSQFPYWAQFVFQLEMLYVCQR